jgi:hypothetical protein
LGGDRTSSSRRRRAVRMTHWLSPRRLEPPSSWCGQCFEHHAWCDESVRVCVSRMLVGIPVRKRPLGTGVDGNGMPGTPLISWRLTVGMEVSLESGGEGGPLGSSLTAREMPASSGVRPTLQPKIYAPVSLSKHSSGGVTEALFSCHAYPLVLCGSVSLRKAPPRRLRFSFGAGFAMSLKLPIPPPL